LLNLPRLIPAQPANTFREMNDSDKEQPRPFRIAIVGAGPAGFYAADRLLRDERQFEVEMFDRLPTPWGLVRAGVAPDHPKIKAVTRVYEKTAARERFRFHGNVEIGSDLSHDELVSCHDAVIYTYGASRDRRLGIPGEDLPGSVPATSFVAWYNGHPDAAHHDFDLSGKRAVVIGNGNVAIDVARMMVLPREELQATDIADHAIDAIANSSIEEVVIIGRRGPAQAAYTTPELRELGELTDSDVVVDPAEIELDPASKAWLESDDSDRTSRDNVEIVQEYSTRTPSGKPKRVVLKFLASPVEIIGDDKVTAVRLVHNELKADGDQIRAVAGSSEEVLECDLVLRSVGYRGSAIEGLPFNESAGTVLNADGRVLASDGAGALRGVYTAGWIKRGPSGVIGTNKKCANDTVDKLIDDLDAGLLPTATFGAEQLDALLAERCPNRVDYSGWERINTHELSEGEAQGRPRVKLVHRDDMIEKSRG
jgi:ferredoxin--NADP+ reductase